MANIKIQGVVKIKTVSHRQQYNDQNPVMPGDLGVVEGPHPSSGFWYLRIKGCRIWFDESDFEPIETIIVNGKKFIQCSPGDKIEPGFMIKCDGYSVKYFSVYRVTQTTAVINYGAADDKFPRIVSGYFRPKGKKGMSTVVYSAFKPFDP